MDKRWKGFFSATGMMLSSSSCWSSSEKAAEIEWDRSKKGVNRAEVFSRDEEIDEDGDNDEVNDDCSTHEA